MGTSSGFLVDIGWFEIAVVSLGIVMVCGLSRLFSFDIHRDLAVASLRAAAQLTLVGFVLGWAFEVRSLHGNALIFALMTLIAGQAVVSRLARKTWRAYVHVLLTLVLAVWPVGIVAIIALFGENALKTSALVIPFLGVLLGNTIAAVSLTFIGLERAYREGEHEISSWSALGATDFEAARRLYAEVLRAAMTPLLNGMTIVGLVSLPGVMAGQVMSGADAMVAARFQIVIMFMMASVSMIGSLIAIGLQHLTRFQKRGQVREMEIAEERRGAGATFEALELRDGERLVIQGPSGVGKSVWLREVAESKRGEAQRCLYLHQKPFFYPGTVEENILFPLRFKANRESRFERRAIEEFLERLALPPELLKRQATTLSGGEAQIVHLIRALILNARLLLLDEPTAALDPERTMAIEMILKSWVREEKGRRFVLVSHSPDQARRMATRVFVMSNDRNLNESASPEFAHAPELA